MPDKIHTSQKEDSWDDYWALHSIEQQLDLCKTDGLLPIFRRFLPKGGLILEAGCGLGKWVIYFKKMSYRIAGLDSNLGCLKKINEYDEGAQIINGQVESLPIKDKSLDAYVSLGVIEHFEDGPMQVLREAQRVLKPNGLAIIEVPCLNLIRKIVLPLKISYRWIRKELNRQPKDYYFTEYRYSKNELINLLETIGFEVIFVSPKDDIMPNRNIGLWLDFSFVRAKGNNDPEHELNKLGRALSALLRFISPWLSCGCVVCVAKNTNG